MCNNYDYDWKMLKIRIKHAKDSRKLCPIIMLISTSFRLLLFVESLILRTMNI